MKNYITPPGVKCVTPHFGAVWTQHARDRVATKL